jgi:hypothetical protein
MSIELELTQEEQKLLEKEATRLGVSVSELVTRSVERMLQPKAMTFDEAMKHTIEKNVELYKRLA